MFKKVIWDKIRMCPKCHNLFPDNVLASKALCPMCNYDLYQETVFTKEEVPINFIKMEKGDEIK
jgi:uncharacterized paraquat-inducible protein A